MCVCVVSWETLRIPGVLQRLAFTYLAVAMLDVLMAGARLSVSSTVSLTDPKEPEGRETRKTEGKVSKGFEKGGRDLRKVERGNLGFMQVKG